MPTYDYLCKSCDENFEVFHSMNCNEPQNCPSCGHPGTRLLSAGSVIFKGSGFYTTDYRDSGYLEAKKSETSAQKPPETSDSKSSPGKSEDSKKESSPKSTDSASPTASTSTSSSDSSTPAKMAKKAVSKAA